MTIDTSPAAIAAIMDGVTPGPWKFEEIKDDEYGPSFLVEYGGAKVLFSSDEGDANVFRFIADRQLVQALAAERAALRAENEWLRHQINEASEPAFIWGAMDNVHDCDTTLDDYADAVSRAIRSALK